MINTDARLITLTGTCCGTVSVLLLLPSMMLMIKRPPPATAQQENITTSHRVALQQQQFTIKSIGDGLQRPPLTTALPALPASHLSARDRTANRRSQRLVSADCRTRTSPIPKRTPLPCLLTHWTQQQQQQQLTLLLTLLCCLLSWLW